MWFKNLVIYRLTSPWTMSAAELEQSLAGRPLTACNGFEMQSRGWVAVDGEERLLFSQGTQHLLAMGVNQKLLPGSIISQVAKERAAGIAVEQGFPVGRRQMRELKEKVTDELRGRALTKRSVLHAWLDAEQGWLIVDTPSVARAEELVQTLRDTLGTLSVTLLETAKSPSVSMGAWLMFGEVPGRFQIEQDLELQSVKDPRSMIRYVNHPLEAREIQKQISTGKSVTRLGLSWSDRVSFQLNAKLEIKRVQFLDVITEREDGSTEDAAEKFAIDFTLMTGELGAMLKELTDLLGGEARQDSELAA